MPSNEDKVGAVRCGGTSLSFTLANGTRGEEVYFPLTASSSFSPCCGNRREGFFKCEGGNECHEMDEDYATHWF